MKNITVDSMRKLQGDAYSLMAENILPHVLPLVNPNQLNPNQKRAFELTKKWNNYFDANSIAASVFDLWMKRLNDNIWKDEFSVAEIPMRFPSRDRTVQLIQKEPNSKWFDNVKTPQKETLNELVNEAFKFTCDSLERKFGPLSKKWNWGNVKNTNVPHLAKIPGLGSKKLAIGGSKSTVNALSETNGPSWRMVIELGKKPKGHGVYPGGQSGNPGSQFYDNMIDTWAEGKLYELIYLQSVTEKSDKIISHYKISKK
jgi:penicillin amidase